MAEGDLNCTTCTPGCQCPSSTVLRNGKCVPPDDPIDGCPCYHDGRVLKVKAIYYWSVVKTELSNQPLIIANLTEEEKYGAILIYWCRISLLLLPIKIWL